MTSSETVVPQRNNLYGHPAGVATRLLAFFVDLFTVLLLFTLGGHVVTFVLSIVLGNDFHLFDASLASTVALLLWAYLVGRLITLAVVLNAALWTRFGADSTHPVQVHRPSWTIPLIDDKLARFWRLMFGDDDRDPPDPPSSSPAPPS